MYSGRTFQEMKQWDKTIGQTFYEINPKNDKEYRTVRVVFNPFTSSKQGQTSNYIVGVPPDGMQPLSPLMARQLRTVATPAPFF
tara:strand:- start:247 stop:498 length:252 start_codon:yes stop_codon:yes gene_type:complete